MIVVFITVYLLKNQFNSVQLLSRVWLCEPRMPGFPVHFQLPELAQIHVHQVGDAIQLSHPLLSPSPPTLDLLQHQGLFQLVSSSHQVDKYCCFSFSISPSNEHSGLIPFRIEWLDLLADSQESSPTPQFKSINSSALSFIYSPTHTSINDHCKNPSFD